MVANERDQLKRVRDKYCTEKVQFDRQAEEVKEQAEQDAQESRKIGYFMTHKENLIAQLGQLRRDLDAEKGELRSNRIKLGLFKNELATKQKAIENLRYTYITGDQQSMV